MVVTYDTDDVSPLAVELPKQYHRYHDEKLESIARQTLAKHDPVLTQKAMATPIEDIMEQVFDLQIVYRHIRKNRCILGETVFTDSMITVYGECGYESVFMKSGTVLIDVSLTEYKNLGRYRFTCAHELAHWIIDQTYFSNPSEYTPLSSSTKVEKLIERQADRLATRLLMPKCTLKNAYYHGLSTEPDLVAYLANLYQVSQQAMTIRLSELRLL